MKNRRLDGWKNPYSKPKVEYLDSASLICKMKDGTYIPNLNREAMEHAYEAGADAMLEKLLKAQGLSYENSMSIPRLAGFIYSRVAGKKGRIVFIEEERRV